MDTFKLDLTPHGELAVDCVVNGPIHTNTYFVVSENEAIIIDPAWDGEELADKFKQAHPDVLVRALVCTHGHADHMGGIAGLREALGNDVPFLFPKGDFPNLQQSLKQQYLDWGISTPDPPTPTRLIDEGDVIGVGNACIQVFRTPGHTPGGVVLFCAATTGNIAFVGDTLFPGSCGRTDFPNGSQSDIQQSLVRMARLLSDDTLCLIGHGPSTTIGREKRENPYMQG